MRSPSLTTKQHKLFLPDDVREAAKERWVANQSAKAHQGLDDAPFDRIIDFWLLAAVYAVSNKMTPADQPTSKKSFISIGPNANDIKKIPVWWPDLFVLLAVRDWGYEDDRCSDPGELIRLANCYAESGARDLLKQLDHRTDMGSARMYVLANMLTELTERIQIEFRGAVF